MEKLEEFLSTIKLDSHLRYSKISDNDLNYLVGKTNQALESTLAKKEVYKIVASVCNIDYFDMSFRKVLIQHSEVFTHLINLESLRRKGAVQFSHDPFVKDFVDLDIFMSQVNLNPSRKSLKGGRNLIH